MAEPLGERLDFCAEGNDNAAQFGSVALYATERQPRLTWQTFVERAGPILEASRAPL